MFLLSRIPSFRRSFSISTSRAVKEIVINKDVEKGVTTIEGVYKPSPREGKVLDPSFYSDEHSHCHPFCRFNRVHEVKHTDVLILDQFVDSEGKVLERYHTKLCKRQHLRVTKLVKMAQKAGIMDAPKNYYVRNDNEPWHKFNTYWDEKTIDAQWKENERKTYIYKFRK